MTSETTTSPEFFDSHAHLVADDQVRYPRNPMKRAANAPYRPPGVIGQPGGKAGPNPINEVPDVSRMLPWMEQEHVTGAVAVQKRMVYRYDNSYILDSCDQHPELFSAVVMLDPLDEATPALVRKWIADHALSGVRLFGGREEDGSMPWLNSAQALKTWEVADEFGIVMDLEVLAQGGGGPSIPALLDLARGFPNVRIVLDHLLEPELTGDDDFGLDARYERLAGVENIFFKFTTINLDIYREADVPADKVLRRAVDMYGADHIMWGSDIGTSSGTYRDMLQRMLNACTYLNAQERQAVMSDTGRRVFVRGGVLSKR